MTIQKTKLKCPFCGCETPAEYEEEICCMCGSTMKEWTECLCCGEYNIPEGECDDFCDKCKNSVQKKLYDFLKANFTEKEITVLDEVVEEKFYWFIKEYEEKKGIKKQCNLEI